MDGLMVAIAGEGLGRVGAASYASDCFERAEFIPFGGRYNPGRRVPLWEKDRGPYSRIVLNGQPYYMRPDIAEKYRQGELTREQLAEMV